MSSVAAITRKTKLVLAAAAALTLASPAASQDQQPSPNIKRAEPGAFPFMVGIFPASTKRGKESASVNCGGTLVAPTRVLTAAHCVRDDDHAEEDGEHAANTGSKVASTAGADGCTKTQHLDVYVGATDFKKGDRIKSVAICQHPSYKNVRHNYDGDLAIIELERAPKAGIKWSAIDVLDAAAEPRLAAPGMTAVYLGWGTRVPKSPAGVLAEVRPEIIDSEACSSAYRAHYLAEFKKEIGLDSKLEDGLTEYLFRLGVPPEGVDQASKETRRNVDAALLSSAPKRIKPNMICAGNPKLGTNHCGGDSGGPLIVRDKDGKWLQAGIVSWGEACSEKAAPASVYTRTSAFKDWIAKHASGAK